MMPVITQSPDAPPAAVHGGANVLPRLGWMDDAHRRFWLFQLAVWSVYFVVRSGLAVMVGTPLSGLGVRLLVTLSGVAISYGIWRVLRRQPPGRIGRQTVCLLGLGLVGAVLMGHVEMGGQHLTDPGKGLQEWIEKEGLLTVWAREVGWQSFQNLWVLTAWGGIYLGFDYARQLQDERLRAAEAKALAQEAQLKMLRYQLNPHFLFNTLNALSALVLTRETERAEKMILALSKFLRHTLDSDPLLRVPVNRELWAMGLYLAIEKERFGDRLHVIEDIDAQTRNCLVPSLLLQPLIENALKYAVAHRPTGGTITIATRLDGPMLVIRVADDGPGLDAPLETLQGRAASGVGLRNTIDRLDRHYDGAASLRIKNREPIGLEVTLRLPAHYAASDTDNTDNKDHPEDP